MLSRFSFTIRFGERSRASNILFEKAAVAADPGSDFEFSYAFEEYVFRSRDDIDLRSSFSHIRLVWDHQIGSDFF